MIHYLQGDATEPVVEGNKIIAHVVNNVGSFEAGFVAALNKKWPQVRHAYKKHKAAQQLGNIQMVKVLPNTWVANMCAQNNTFLPKKREKGLAKYARKDFGRLIDYDSLEVCLHFLAREAKRLGASVHSPHFGAGIGGGNFEEIACIVEKCLEGIDFYFYEFINTKAASYVPSMKDLQNDYSLVEEELKGHWLFSPFEDFGEDE